MKYTHKQYAQALYEALQDTKPKDQDIVIENFIQILKDKGDLAEYEKIIAVYEAHDREQRGITEVEVTTATGATKLDKSFIDNLNEIIGKDIQIKEKIDSNLIGGIVIKAGDTLIDGSIKHHLDQLHETLTSTE
jgi:F-type H+-transporting ATPase subunit delta